MVKINNREIKGRIFVKIKKEENTMKKINILIVLGVAALLSGLIQPVYAYGHGQGDYEVETWFGSRKAHVTSAISKFEGLLNAYTSTHTAWNQPVRSYTITEQLSTAVYDLSSSLEQLNTVLVEVYPTLSKEEQLTIQNGVVDIIKALQSAATEANLVFGKEVFPIEYLVSKIISIIN